MIAPTAHGTFNETVVYPDVAKAPINLAAPMNILEHWLGKPNKDVEALKPVHYYVMGDCDDTEGARQLLAIGRRLAARPRPPRSFYFHADNSLARRGAQGRRTS